MNALAEPRKIVHVDMDAFYAAVEQRDNPELKGKPVVVAWKGPRSVVCAASYEARPFGIHSAMSAARAVRLCPQAVFVAPDFTRYRAVSRRVREIFERHTDLVEPLSLDEAYLDVTRNKHALASATEVARHIRAEIKEETRLTASAGVAPNKFLAKIASDWCKPDGLFVIQPHAVLDFLAPLAVRKLPGVGPATDTILSELGIVTVANLRTHPAAELETRFGRFGRRLYNLARGVDNNAVSPDRPRKSLSAETTFDRDLALGEIGEVIDSLAERVWQHAENTDRVAHTVVIKLKTSDFRIITRSLTPAKPPGTRAELTMTAQRLLANVDLPASIRYRLAGVGLANFRQRGEMTRQTGLFE